MADVSGQNLEQFTQTELFQRISSICAAVNAVMGARELLEVSLERTMELFGAQRGSIFILKEGSEDLMLKVARGMAVSEEEKMVKRLGKGVVGRVAESKKPIVVSDIARDDRFQDYKARKSYQTPSFICVPLLIKDKLIGVINITDKECGSQFGPNELQLLDFLASQIALNYRRIELYEKLKTVVRESRDLKDELGKSSEEASHLKKQIVLQEKLATIGKLAGGIAHEFNNPLDGVMRYTNLCLEHVKEDEVVHGYLLEMKNGLNRMANIVKSLLACSRNTDPSMEKVNPAQAVEQALQIVKADTAHKNITVERELSQGLPAITDLGLERVLTNLLRNAIDAVDNNGYIRVATFKSGDNVVIEVEDDGCGIDEASVQKIFEPFYTTKDIEKGCGLGLTIVSEIIKSYNGQINVESGPNQGTTFDITIPIG